MSSTHVGENRAGNILAGTRLIPKLIQLYSRWNRTTMTHSLVHPSKQRRVNHAEVVRKPKECRLETEPRARKSERIKKTLTEKQPIIGELIPHADISGQCHDQE
jgi:hypothetical protein